MRSEFAPSFLRSRLAVLAQFVVFAADQFVFDAGIADDHGFANHRGMRHRQASAINFQNVPRFAKQRRNLVENAALHTHEFIFRGAAEFGQL